MVGAQLRERGDVLVDGRVGGVVVDRAERLAGHEGLVLVLGDLAREERLARCAVAADAREALLVAVVDDGLAAAEEQQVVGEQIALERVALPPRK